MILLQFPSLLQRSYAAPPTFMAGADVSFAKQAEDEGTVFKDMGKPEPVLRMLKQHGYNWVRLRLFVHPTDLPNNLKYTIALAQQAKKLGYHFLLDLHYSDTWADPQHQITPVEWQNLSHEQLVRQVKSYTQTTIEAFKAANVLPDMVQIGNEVSRGFLWPDGKLPDNWDHFAELLRAGIDGANAACTSPPRPMIMVHIDKGGNWNFTKTYFDKLASYHISFDVIGLSYYPWWHGTLEELRNNLDNTAQTFHKPIVVVETAYNWRPSAYKPGDAPFPETPKGQKQYLEAVYRIVRNVPDGLGVGIFWWEPAVPAEGPYAVLESRSFFDNDHEALPAITVFDALVSKAHHK